MSKIFLILLEGLTLANVIFIQGTLGSVYSITLWSHNSLASHLCTLLVFLNAFKRNLSLYIFLWLLPFNIRRSIRHLFISFTLRFDFDMGYLETFLLDISSTHFLTLSTLISDCDGPCSPAARVYELKGGMEKLSEFPEVSEFSELISIIGQIGVDPKWDRLGNSSLTTASTSLTFRKVCIAFASECASWDTSASVRKPSNLLRTRALIEWPYGNHKEKEALMSLYLRMRGEFKGEQ